MALQQMVCLDTTLLLSEFEGYAAGAWGSIGGGASAGGAIYENTDDITSNYTLTTGSNGMSVGPITIAARQRQLLFLLDNDG